MVGITNCMNLWEAYIYLKKIFKYHFIPALCWKKKTSSEQTSLLNCKEFKTISYRELSTCELLFNLLMNIPGLQILNSGHSCSRTYLDHRRQLGYFQNEVTRNSADHKVRDKTNTTQNALWTKHKMFHSSFTLLRWVPRCQLVAASQKEETCFYIKPSVCIHNIHTYKNTCL